MYGKYIERGGANKGRIREERENILELLFIRRVLVDSLSFNFGSTIVEFIMYLLSLILLSKLKDFQALL